MLRAKLSKRHNFLRFFFIYKLKISMTPKERVLFITGWILDYCSKMPKKPSSLVVGVSGGIDSAVVSTICASTGMKTFALSMPIKQIKEQDDLSKAHCEWLQKVLQM